MESFWIFHRLNSVISNSLFVIFCFSAVSITSSKLDTCDSTAQDTVVFQVCVAPVSITSVFEDAGWFGPEACAWDWLVLSIASQDWEIIFCDKKFRALYVLAQNFQSSRYLSS